MTRSIIIGSLGASICLGLSVTPLAAQSVAAGAVAASKMTTDTKPATQCLDDIRTFEGQMQKGGFWLGGSDYGYGYPMDGIGYGGGYGIGGLSPGTNGSYRNARPGYEVRALIASASILARRGQQQPCEDLLTTTRDVYKVYIAKMESGGASMATGPGWRDRQISAAQPVGNNSSTLRSDEILNTGVDSPHGIALGSVEDIVISPTTGKIAYLVIARGGLFGIDQKYVPVPWDDFKISPNANLLVLDTTKSGMENAPQVGRDQFATWNNFDQESQKVDAYWKTQLSSNPSQ